MRVDGVFSKTQDYPARLRPRLVCAANIRLTCAARLVRVEGSRKLIFRLKMRVGGKNAVRQYWKRAFFFGGFSKILKNIGNFFLHCIAFFSIISRVPKKLKFGWESPGRFHGTT